MQNSFNITLRIGNTSAPSDSNIHLLIGHLTLITSGLTPGLHVRPWTGDLYQSWPTIWWSNTEESRGLMLLNSTPGLFRSISLSSLLKLLATSDVYGL